MVFERHENYKSEQEAFVSNVIGTTPLEFYGLTMFVVFIPIIEEVLKRKFKSFYSHWVIEIILKSFFYFLLESSLLLNFPIIEKKYFSLGLILLYFFTFLFIFVFHKKEEDNDNNKKNEKHIPFISEYRHSMQISTIMAILFVDFQLFPRRLAKVETFGYSLMDAGVGSFVFSGAIVSNSARNVKAKPTLSKLLHSLLPLSGLALFRFLFVKTVNYQSHVSEYGVHWNFFTTLMFISLITFIVDDLLKLTDGMIATLMIAITCTLLQQVLLSYFGMQELVLYYERNNFFLANKEGFCTLLGYLAIHFFGVSFGKFTFQFHKSRVKFYRNTLIFISICLSLLFILPFNYYSGYNYIHSLRDNESSLNTFAYQVDKAFIQENNLWFSILIPSRRMTNFGYIMSVAAFNVTLLTLFYLVDCKFSSFIQFPSTLRDAMNFNPLFCFLFANILTGLINLSIQTIYVENWVIVTFIMMFYATIVSVSAVYLYKKKRKIF
ncbi:hypothetical protein ABK040_006549 [Willaertia magna]